MSSSLSTVSNIFKKITSTATGCEAIGGLTAYLSAIMVKRFYNKDTGEAVRFFGCSSGVLLGLAYSSICNKFDDKITLGLTALTALSISYNSYNKYNNMPAQEISDIDKRTSFVIQAALITSFSAIAATAASEGLQYAVACYNAR